MKAKAKVGLTVEDQSSLMILRPSACRVYHTIQQRDVFWKPLNPASCLSPSFARLLCFCSGKRNAVSAHQWAWAVGFAFDIIYQSSSRMESPADAHRSCMPFSGLESFGRFAANQVFVHVENLYVWWKPEFVLEQLGQKGLTRDSDLNNI